MLKLIIIPVEALMRRLSNFLIDLQMIGVRHLPDLHTCPPFTCRREGGRKKNSSIRQIDGFKDLA